MVAPGKSMSAKPDVPVRPLQLQFTLWIAGGSMPLNHPYLEHTTDIYIYFTIGRIWQEKIMMHHSSRFERRDWNLAKRDRCPVAWAARSGLRHPPKCI